ncbi:MAG: ORF6N domain-containing protein [Selenomonadaceae bacterium]|nr:ORF6N domain-containing protein [Selenomonadaceae bacterium]
MDTTLTVITENENPYLGEITRIEYKGQLVLTTKQLADFYGTKVINITSNFNRNKSRFIEGKHYFKLVGEELAAFKNFMKNFQKTTGRDIANCYVVDSNVNSLYLWTKRGAARHCKSVGTDMAWDMFELLEDNYFNRATAVQDKELSSISDFERGKELAKLAMSARDPFTKKRLVAKAANLILGEEFIPVPETQPAPKMQLTLF